uniref:Beta-defensin n=1 Tax=Prolemur simus TaxID=1328070 RepID=A0A8C9DEP0_PROSS
MKFLYLWYINYLSLLFSVYRGRQFCWIMKGHCRQNCKPGEQVKKSCKNGDYCCIPSKTYSQPYRPSQGPSKKDETFNNDLRELEGNLENFQCFP